MTINNYAAYYKQSGKHLSSQELFDFNGYLSQFPRGHFMEKLVATQCFNIFIEEPSEFFRTNLQVMLGYSFKRLKREQDKIIERNLMNLSNVRIP